MGIEKRFAQYLNDALLFPEKRVVAPLVDLDKITGVAEKNYTPNQKELALSVIYEQCMTGDENTARRLILERTNDERRSGHCGKEGPLGGPSHFQWWGIAKAAQRIIALRRNDKEVLAASDWWWGSVWVLCEKFWQPAYGKNKQGGVLYVGPRAWGDKAGGKGKGGPGTNDYLDDLAGALVFGQARRLKQSGAEPDSTVMRLCANLATAAGESFGRVRFLRAECPKLQAPISICREGSNAWIWWTPPGGVTGPILYALRIREHGQFVDWFWEPTEFGKVATEVIGS